VIAKLAKDNDLLVFEVGDPMQPSWMQTDVKNNNNGKEDFGYDISEYGGFVIGNLAGIWRAENDSL
jgi:hypothetical protein